MSELKSMSRIKILAILTVLTFLTSLIAIGHGIIPIGLSLAISLSALVNPNPGDADSGWVTVFVIAWLAIGVLVGSCLLKSRGAWWSALCGAILCGIAWTGFVLYSDPPGTTFVLSAHFIVLEVLLVRHLLTNPPE